MHVVLADVPLQDQHVLGPEDLPDQLPQPQADGADEHRLAGLRRPDQVQGDLEDAVRPVPVLSHGGTFYRGMLKPSPEGEGFNPPSNRQ
jgi:hypothetical protein